MQFLPGAHRPRTLAALLAISVIAIGATLAHQAGAEIPESKWSRTGKTLVSGVEVSNRMAGVAAHQYTYIAPRDGAVRVTMIVLPVSRARTEASRAVRTFVFSAATAPPRRGPRTATRSTRRRRSPSSP